MASGVPVTQSSSYKTSTPNWAARSARPGQMEGLAEGVAVGPLDRDHRDVVDPAFSSSRRRDAGPSASMIEVRPFAGPSGLPFRPGNRRSSNSHHPENRRPAGSQPRDVNFVLFCGTLGHGDDSSPRRVGPCVCCRRLDALGKSDSSKVSAVRTAPGLDVLRHAPPSAPRVASRWRDQLVARRDALVDESGAER